jgi:hypothetical protein
MWIDPIQMVGDGAELRGLRGYGYFSGHDTAVAAASAWSVSIRATASRSFRVVRTMYPPTSGHESTASRHAP